MSFNRLCYVPQVESDEPFMGVKSTNNDVNLLVEDKKGRKETLPGHKKFLMASNSQKINELFTRDVRRSLSLQDDRRVPPTTEDDKVQVNVWSLEGFRVVFKFIYTGELNFPDSLAIDVLADLVQFGFEEQSNVVLDLVVEKKLIPLRFYWAYGQSTGTLKRGSGLMVII